MKLTSPLQHAKYFWWGKGWAPRPRKNTDHFYYKMQWKSKSRRRLQVISQTLPDGVQPIDANLYIKQALDEEFQPHKPFVLPWPYSERPIKGSPNDPNYKTKPAFVYHRYKRIVEPINLPLYFTNSILENNLPEPIEKFQSNVKIEDKFLDYCKRRIQWALENDSAMRKLPLNKEFPYLDQRPPRVWGTTINKKEYNLLQTLYDIATIWNNGSFGFNPKILLQRVSQPHCVVSLNRNNKFVILDLECDFITLLSEINNEASSSSSLKNLLFDTDFQKNTQNKPLKSINPISWEVGFDEKNFYPDDFEFQIPKHSSIQTIFLSNNQLRMLNDEDYQGRGIMFCYGYAIQQAKFMNDHGLLQSKQPITIQCLYVSPKNFNIGFVLFQLNNLNDDDNNDNDIRNQVWLSQPRSIINETEQAILDLVTIQSFKLQQSY